MTRSRLPSILVPALLLTAMVPALLAAPAAGAPATLVAGWEPGAPAPAAILAGPWRVAAIDSALGFAILEAPDGDAALASLLGARGILFAERDGLALAAGARAEGASWDGASWDGASWDSTRWDSTRWDSTRWDGASWDSTRWDSTRWDSTRWDGASWDSTRWDSTRWDSTRWDGGFQTDPLFQQQWALQAINAHEAWTLFQGARGRTICVVDSGVDGTHPDLAPNLWRGADGRYGASFVDGRNDPMDRAGHGTHMAGIAAAALGNGLGISGVGNEKIMAVKVLNDQGIGGLGNLAQGIRWCADHDAHVISLSLSSQQDSTAVRRAVEYAQARGLLLVASAGNHADCANACAVYPAAYPGVLGVSALDMARNPMPFSVGGPHVDLAAPGEKVAGTYLDHDYALGTGTSQATALVAGAAALAWDLDHDLSADEVAALLLASARDAGASGRDDATGHGVLDLRELLLRAHP